MEGLDYWRLCDELTVVQAALLVANVDPSKDQDFIEQWQPVKRPVGYDAAKAAISNALRKKLIEGTIMQCVEYDSNGNPCGSINGSVDIETSRVDVYSLRLWLKGRGFNSGFFTEYEEEKPDYLDKNHSRYSPKLAACIMAWMTVDESSLKGKSPKQALDKWIRENAAQFGLTDDEGMIFPANHGHSI